MSDSKPKKPHVFNIAKTTSGTCINYHNETENFSMRIPHDMFWFEFASKIRDKYYSPADLNILDKSDDKD